MTTETRPVPHNLALPARLLAVVVVVVVVAVATVVAIHCPNCRKTIR